MTLLATVVLLGVHLVDDDLLFLTVLDHGADDGCARNGGGAELLGLTGVKGCVCEGADADLLILGEDLAIDSLFAKGKAALWQGEVRMKGRFE